MDKASYDIYDKRRRIFAFLTAHSKNYNEMQSDLRYTIYY